MLRYATIIATLFAVALAYDPFRVVFQWKYIDVVWPSEEARQDALIKQEYIQNNNAIAGIKLWKNRMYLTIPRWRPGVPVTLGVTMANPVNGSTAPKLQAYPNWDMQEVGNCDSLQFVQSMEIDPLGRMWVIDSGRVDTMTLQPKSKCPAKLVILDLENEGQVMKTYTFPSDVASPATAFLNDIVLDHEDGGFAYISDSSTDDPGLIVYSLQNDTAWKVRHDSMKASQEAVRFIVSNTQVNFKVHIDGIALSPASDPDRYVLYSPLSSFNLYSIPTWALKNRNENPQSHVRDLNRKSSQSDGMAMSADGVLFFGLLADDALATWETKKTSFTMGQRIITRDHSLMQWPDSMAIDEDGSIWCVTNSLQDYITDKIDRKLRDPRIGPSYYPFRIVKTQINARSYQYYQNGNSPALPMISGAASLTAVTQGVLITLALLLFSK